MDNSISGSESSDEESDASDSDAVDALVSKNKRAARSESPEQAQRSALTALTWFHSPPSTQIGVYRAIFDAGTADYLAELKELQSSPQGRTWALFMTAGGHFAGAVVRVAKSDEDREEDRVQADKKKRHKPKPEIEVLKHKTFHRYTSAYNAQRYCWISHSFSSTKAGWIARLE